MNKVVHLKKDRYDVRIDRATPWGNPFTHIRDRKTKAEYVVNTREESIAAHAEWVTTSDDPRAVWVREHILDLRGKVLGCWCAPLACHGDTLSGLAHDAAVAEFAEALGASEIIKIGEPGCLSVPEALALGHWYNERQKALRKEQDGEQSEGTGQP